ncbi:MAG TPA: glycoside hydrolase family 2 TIM barrel-domain containing protein [Candidatus Limiplasma sp.]|nr:glycoside hydrolase family 2 TIM barrel-domain containing protein [Candidatus Limiplasma sp.]HRX09644.1 glycoside hydrolase family 2 TIM barrel-domain containing protein [Candidatus Limiplasma sp.]
MLRLFETTHVRMQTELNGTQWFFSSPIKTIQNVCVPSCWETYPGMERYRGTCTYCTTFIGGGNLRLIFKGVSFQTNVYLDNQPLGSHSNAYTPFDFIILKASQGEHTLRVDVSNEFSEESALHIPNDYRSWGGITRGVMVETLADAYIRSVQAIPFQKDGIWHAAISAGIQNLSDSQLDAQVSVYLAGECMRLEIGLLSPHERKEIHITIACPQAQTYELSLPKLFELRAVLESNGVILDDLIDRIGFRTIQVSGKRILYNDRPISIRGFNRHESHGLYGCALPLSAMATDMQIIKDLNANAIRTSHYPNDELFLDLCDEQGILVWEEAHARGLNLSRMRHPLFQSQSLEGIQAMIQSHINHPSIFIWGCLNECQSNSDFGKECYTEQFNAMRQLDSSRPITSASCYPRSDVVGLSLSAFQPSEPGIHDGDICLGLQDIISFNMYPLWYTDIDPTSQIMRLREWINTTGNNNKPLIISEIGAGAIAGFHSAAHDKWSEERQADILEQAIRAVFDDPEISGVFIWQFCDCLVDENWALSRPKTLNNKGVVDEYRRPKMSYNTVKRLFGEYS